MKLTILNILQLCQLWTMQLAMETGTTDYVHNLRTKKSQLSGVLGRYIELQFIFTPTNEDTLNKFTVIYDENGEKSFSIYTQNMTSTFVMNSTSSKDFSFDINMVEGTFDLVLKNTKKNDVLNISVTAFYGNVEETSTVEIVKIMENPIVPLFNAKYITSNELVTLSWMCSTYNPVKSIDIHYIRTKTNQEIFISNKAIDKNSLTISLTAYEFRYVDGFLYVYIYNVSSSDSFDFVLRLQYFSNIGQNPTFETSVIHVNVEDTNDDCNTHGNSTCLIGHTTSNSLESTYMTYHHKSNVQITSTAYNQSIETLQISPSILPSLTFIPNHYRSTEDTGKLTLLTSVFPIERSKYIKIVSTSSLLSNSKDLNHNKSTTFQMHKSVAFQMQNSNKTIAMDQSSSVQSSVGPTTTSKYTQNIFTDLAKVNVTISNVANISLTLESMLQDGLDENKITENDIETVINLVSSCLDVTTSDEKVNKNLLGAANIIIKSTDKVSLNRNVKKTFRYQLKRIAIGSTVNNTDGFHYKGEEISLFSFVQKSSEEIALFVSDSNDISKSSQLQPNHTISSIIINNGTFLMKINNTSNLSMYSYSFTNDRLFEGIDSKQVIVSSILDFTLPNFKIENLDNNFSINFETDTLETSLECGYWSEDIR